MDDFQYFCSKAAFNYKIKIYLRYFTSLAIISKFVQTVFRLSHNYLGLKDYDRWFWNKTFGYSVDFNSFYCFYFVFNTLNKIKTIRKIWKFFLLFLTTHICIHDLTKKGVQWRFSKNYNHSIHHRLNQKNFAINII